MKKIKRLILIILGLSLVSGSISRIDAQKNKDASFTIITYNIRMNTPDDGENAWPLRKDKVAGLLKFHGADIFNVQEALPEQMDDLTASFPDFDHVGVGRDDGKRAGEHMGIFYNRSRFEKLGDGMFWLSETPDKPGFGWDAACNRTCTWIKLKDRLTGNKFLVLDTHLDHRGVKAREEGTKLILSRLPELNKEGLPLILTGDFNLVKEASPIQNILGVLSDAKEKTATPPYGPDGTSGGFPVRAKNRTIDFIFINDRVKVLRFGVLSDSFNTFHPSDHLPVLAEVNLQKAK